MYGAAHKRNLVGPARSARGNGRRAEAPAIIEARRRGEGWWTERCATRGPLNGPPAQMVNRFFASRMLLEAWRSPSLGEAAYGRAASQVIFAARGEMNGTQPGRQEGAGSGGGRGCGASPIGRGRRVPRADGRT